MILDEGNEGPRSIETVSRSGYRFRKDVTRLPDRGTIRGSHQPAHSGPARASIAILPFVNLSADPDNEYFSDGLTEEIINRLARFPGLKVIARTSAFAFKNAQQDVRRIAGALGVAHVLEGSVRKSGRRIRVSAQLIRASDGGHIWARRFDREIADVFEMQDVIADAIATTLHGDMLTAPIIQRYTPDVPTYEAFLKGVHHLNKMTPQSMVRARECLEKAIACDARFAAAHGVLATYFIVLAANSHQPATEVMPLARAAAVERWISTRP